MTEEEGNALKRRAACLSVLSNALLVLLKLAVGVHAGAVSLVSEAVHSAVDLLAACIAFFAVRKAGQPPDAKHAYGHGKFENLSSVAEALLIVFAAVWIMYESLHKLRNLTVPEYLEYGILVMAVSIVVNYAVSFRLMTVARQTQSQALEADSLHLRADIWTSIGVLAGLALISLTGWLWLDPAIAIGVALIIFKAGYRMTLESTRELTDIRLPQADESLIEMILRSHPAVLGFHRLRTRRSGAYRLLDVHIVLDKQMRLEQVHEICDQLEGQIKRRFGMCDVVIHAEPLGHHPETRFLRRLPGR